MGARSGILRKKWLHALIMTVTEVKSVQLYFLFNCFLRMQERRCLKLVHSWHYHDQSIPACSLPYLLCRPLKINFSFLGLASCFLCPTLPPCLLLAFSTPIICSFFSFLKVGLFSLSLFDDS